MKFDQIEHYDHFDTETIFWADISDMPEVLQGKAREIDGAEFNPSCFGVCVIYDWAKKEFDMIVDVDPSTGKHCNVYYIDTDGEKHWFKAELAPEFTQEIFAACDKDLKAIQESKTHIQQKGANDMPNYDDLFTSLPAQQEETPFDKDAWAAKKQAERESVYAMIAHNGIALVALHSENCHSFITPLVVDLLRDRTPFCRG